MKFDTDSLERCFSFSNLVGHESDVTAVNTTALARWIMEIIPIRCIIETKEVLTYVHGKFIPNGLEFIHKVLTEALSPYRKTSGAAIYTSHLHDEVVHIVRGLTYIHADKFDADLNWINVENGMLNWKTGEFTEHDPGFNSRIQIPVKYDPYAVCPSIQKILKIILRPEDYVKMLEFIAYMLYRAYPISKAFIMIGPGKTGKSTLMEIIERFIGGSNCSSVSMHDIEHDRFATSDLYNKLFNGMGDMAQTNMPNANNLKMLTSGKDRIRGQKKGKQAFDFVNFAKIMFGTNKLPKVADDSDGFYRRVELIAMFHQFTPEEKDPRLLEAAQSDEEMSGLLNLVLPYLAPLLERGEFTNGTDTSSTATQYKVGSDPIPTFIETYVEEVPDAVTVKRDIYDTYVKFCNRYDVTPLCEIWFGREFAKHMPWRTQSQRIIGGRSRAVWLNLRLKPQGEVDGTIPT